MTTKTSQFQGWAVGQELELEFDLTGQNTQEAKLEFDSELKEWNYNLVSIVEMKCPSTLVHTFGKYVLFTLKRLFT